ncbi:hypothetical protein ACSFB7_29030 [Variovorax sp. GB1P17]
MEHMPATLWIAACAHRLQQRWHTVDFLELEELARELWRDAQLRAMLPDEAAAHWLRPITEMSRAHADRSDLSPVFAPVPGFSLTGQPSPAGQPVRGP